MALYAFDGTWNEDEDAPEGDTNVVKFRDLYEGPVEYRQGVGTRFGTVGRLLGGLFGIGGRSRIEEMYEAAKENWQHGDRVFDIVGFSRGAALAVHFANVLGEQGLRLPDGRVEKPEIRFLGLWDIVGSFGFPLDFVIKFQHINLGWTIDRVPATVQHCVHGMALDERREAFTVTRLNRGNTKPRIDETWFRGVHSDVGGGNGNIRRGNISLHWMAAVGRTLGLPISQAHVEVISKEVDRLAPISENRDPQRDLRRPTAEGDHFHPTAMAKRLHVGQSERFPVRAPDRYSWSGVRLERGATYRMHVAGQQQWQDAGISCDANGWTSESLPWYKEAVIKHLEPSRRLPEANWFELVGALDDEDTDLFRIGTQLPRFTASREADLYAFANDLKSARGNNRGEIVATVERLS